MGDAGNLFDENALVPVGDEEAPTWIVEAARVANAGAQEDILENSLETCSDQTIRRHKAAIALFEQYLEEARKEAEKKGGAGRRLPPMKHLFHDLAHRNGS